MIESLLGQMQGDPCMSYLNLLLIRHPSPLWSIYSVDLQSLFFDRYYPHLGRYLNLRDLMRLYLDYFDQPGAHIFFSYLHQGFFWDISAMTLLM